MGVYQACQYEPRPPSRIQHVTEGVYCEGLCGTERAVELGVGGTAIVLPLFFLLCGVAYLCRGRVWAKPDLAEPLLDRR